MRSKTKTERKYERTRKDPERKKKEVEKEEFLELEREKIQKEKKKKVEKDEFLERSKTDECLKLFENLAFDQFSSMKSEIEVLENEREKAYSCKAKNLVKNAAFREKINGLETSNGKHSIKIKKLKRKLKNCKHRGGIKDCFSPIRCAEELRTFITNRTSLSRHNLSNETHRNNNKEAVKQIFGFQSFQETISYAKALFQDVALEHPTLCFENKTIVFKPARSTAIEQILITKFFMHSMPNRSKCSVFAGAPRKAISKALKKWAPMWGTFGSCLSMLPMDHGYYEKELPDEHKENNLMNVAHLEDGKDILIETMRNNDSLKRRIWSEKVHESAARTLNFSTPMGLSFEHARAAGARASEKKIAQWWGSAEKHALCIKDYFKHFENNESPPPRNYWIATNNDETNNMSYLNFESYEKDTIDSIFDSSSELIFNESVLNSSYDYKSGQIEDRACSEIDDWFDHILHLQIKKNIKDPSDSNHLNDEINSLNKELKEANESSPQHNLNELANQMLFLERLHVMHENKKLKKCTISAYLFMTKEYRNNALNYLGLSNEIKLPLNVTEPTIWLRSAKVPFNGECLADKGFENTDRLFAHFNRVRCPRILRNREAKQYDVIELLSKGAHCRLRCASEVNFSFFENVDAVKDFVPIENIWLLPHAIECGCALVNLQQPLRKPGNDSGLSIDYWN